MEILSQVSNTSTIFYVGGFCQSKTIVSLIKKKIINKYPNIKHICPLNPGNAILKGAFLFGLNPERIKTKKAKYSIAMSAYLDWDSKYENGGERYYDSEF